MSRAKRKTGGPSRICVIGAGVSGMAAAWLLSKAHDVVLLEAEPRLGGHTFTVAAPTPSGPTPVDMGFIVYNEATYPNLTALFAHLGVATRPSDMSFSVSLDGGRFEYGSTDLSALFAQRRNLLNPRFWGLLNDLRRFYAAAPGALQALDDDTSLGEFLTAGGYGQAFQDAHILPQAAAIWSSSPQSIRDFPAAAFIRFFQNHGLLELNVRVRPQWRTVAGGSSAYIPALTASIGSIRLGAGARCVKRCEDRIEVVMADGDVLVCDEVVIAAHAPDALALLAAPTEAERALLSALAYRPNRAVLHTDARLMPRRRTAWSAWNFIGSTGGRGEVTYWMNRLQGLDEATPFFVSLNPPQPPRPETVLHVVEFAHPVFDAASLRAQRQLWSLQGVERTWFCGAYFGSGFHEDGLQAGLAVAEALGGVPRPWTLAEPSGRIHLPPSARAA